MANVDFYLLNESSIENAYSVACKLVDKVYQQRQQLYVCANSMQESNILDDLLWTFRDDAFIPHSIYGTSPNQIQIGVNADPVEHQEVLLNLTPIVPDFYLRFKRILELVPQDRKEISRQKFRFYRENNCEITTHDLTKTN